MLKYFLGVALHEPSDWCNKRLGIEDVAGHRGDGAFHIRDPHQTFTAKVTDVSSLDRPR